MDHETRRMVTKKTGRRRRERQNRRRRDEITAYIMNTATWSRMTSDKRERELLKEGGIHRRKDRTQPTDDDYGDGDDA